VKNISEACGVADKCVLQQMVESTPTGFWNDSCETATLKRAIGWGASGATTNPVIVLECVKADPRRWASEVTQIQSQDKTLTEIETAWELIHRMACQAMPILHPVYKKTNGHSGRLTVQVNPKYFTDSEKMIAHALEIAKWGENVAIKIPAVEAGFTAMEELVARGIAVVSTVQFSVSQAIETAEAFERGYRRAQAHGIDITTLPTFAAIMVGRLDDHLRDEQKEKKLPVNSEDIHHAGLAVFKRVSRLFQQRGYRAKPMAAAIRGSYHCMSFVGGDVVVTLPPAWQVFVNGAEEPIIPQAIDLPEPDAKIKILQKHFPDFNSAYEADGIKITDFVKFGSTRKTLRQFIAGYDELLKFVRECMI
jgi:transaldolase